MGISSAPDEINNAFTKLGSVAPSQMTHLSNVDGATVAMYNGEQRITGFFNAAGGGYATIVNNPEGPGDGKSMAKNRRFTKNFLTGSGDSSQTAFTLVKNPNGAGLTMMGGGGAKDTISLSTADGQNFILITDGMVSVGSKGYEFVWDGNNGTMYATYLLVKSQCAGCGKVVNGPKVESA